MRFLASILAVVVSAEFLVMLVLPFFGRTRVGTFEALLDISLLSALIVPPLYLLLSRSEHGRRKAEGLQKGLEQTFRTLAEHSMAGVYIIEGERFSYVNPAFAEIFGYTPEDILRLPSVLELVSEQDRASVSQRIGSRREGVAHEVRAAFIGRRRDGTSVHVEILGSAIVTAGKRTAIGTLLDITARKRDEMTIRQSLDVQVALNRLLRHSISDAPLETTLDRFLTDLLDVPWLAIERKGAIFCSDGKETLVLKAQRGLPPPLLKACASVRFGHCLCGRAAQTKTLICEELDQGHHDVSYPEMQPHGHYCVPILSQGKDVLGVVSLYLKTGHARQPMEEFFLTAVADILTGILLRKRAEDARLEGERMLLQSQKFEALGRLAGGVAHDFNNMLTVISGSGTMILEALPAGSPLRSDMTDILNASKTASKLSRQLLSFARGRPQAAGVSDMNLLIRGLEGLLERLAGKQISIGLALHEAPLAIPMDSSRFEQILVNLTVNARDAMPGGGRILISTSRKDFTSPPQASQPLPIGRYAEFSITDTGTGMSEAVRSRIFEPFFTTKPEGKGNGLGLSTVYGIVQQVKGSISVESSPGKGTTVRILLPLDESPIPSA